MRRRVLAAVVVAASALAVGGCSAAREADSDLVPVACTGGAVGDWDGKQTAVARAITQVALSLNLGEKGAVIGVAVGITESTLRELDYGDQYLDGSGMTTSRGPFQQKDTWGPLADRLDATKSASMFFTGGQIVPSIPGDGEEPGLTDISGWENMPPHLAAQAVQRSSYRDGSNFAKNVPAAQSLVQAIATACQSPGAAGVNLANGVQVTIPNNQYVDAAVRGKTITAPSEAAARGLAAGFDQLGLPYVWGGGGSGAGPNDGCARGEGALNSCQGIIGFDCSGLTAYVLGQAGYQIPGDSYSQRAGGVSVPVGQARPLDIYGFPGHVSISLGTIDGVAYHLEASQVGVPVHIVPMRRGDVDSSAHRYWQDTVST